jgi:hypothetical protein
MIAAPLFLLAVSAVPWIVLPAYCEKPPPKDPTLLRISAAVGEALQSALKEDVRVASTELRDEHCPQEDGRCPPFVADALGAERAISLVLAPDYRKLVVRVFKGTTGMESEGSIKCAWNVGEVGCELDKLRKVVKRPAEAPPIDPEAVRKAFDALRPKLDRCTNGAAAPKDASVSFRLRPDGHAIDVRIDPEELNDDPGYQCVARTVESLRTRAFSSDKPELFRFALAPSPPAKSKVDRKKKKR